MRPTRDNRTLAVVSWAAATVAALGFVLAYGGNFPWADEWEFVPALLNDEPFVPWLWTQHNEHRLPLPRLVYYGLFQLTHDFRAGMLLQVIIVSGTAWRALRYLQRVRGTTSWIDPCVPWSLLHFGHAENWLMGYQICFALVLAFTTELTIRFHGLTVHNRPRQAWIIAGLAAASALCGGAGLIVVPGVALWLAFVAVRHRHRQWALLVPAVALPLYLLVYFQDYVKPAHHPQATWADLPRGIAIAGEFLAMSLGLVTEIAWPLVALVLPLGFAAAVVQLVESRTTETPERNLGLAWMVSAALGSAAAIGYGRAGFGSWTMGIASRYSWLAWPGLFLLVLTAARRDAPPLAPVLRNSFVITFFGLTVGNTVVGIGWAESLQNHLRPFAADCRAGVADDVLIDKYLQGSGQEERAVRGLPLLRAAKIGPFADGGR